MYVFQGLTVGWWKEERHSSDTTARSTGFKSQAGWASRGCCVCMRVMLSRKEKGEERVGVGGRGKYPGAPPHIRKKEERKKQADRRVPDRPGGERGKVTTKKKKKEILMDSSFFWDTLYLFKSQCDLTVKSNRGFNIAFFLMRKLVIVGMCILACYGYCFPF
jgi:hypothetical protein